MAPPSMWLAACSVMMLYVAVPHASCHPTPDDASHHEVMPYFQQHDPQPYYYDEEEEYGKEKTNLQDYEPVLAEKEVDEDKKYLNSRLIEAAIVLGYIYFLYHVLRPEDFFPRKGRQLGVEEDYSSEYYSSSYYSNVTNNIMSDAFTFVMNSLDPVEMGLDLLSVDGHECRHRMVCEGRHMVASVPLLDDLAQQHGWLLGSVPSYQEALSEGRSKGDCGQKYSQCPSTQLTSFYNILN